MTDPILYIAATVHRSVINKTGLIFFLMWSIVVAQYGKENVNVSKIPVSFPLLIYCVSFQNEG